MSIKRLATHVAGGAAIAAAMAAFTVVPAHAADTYVAIYYSAPEYAYGWANNAPTRADAEAAASWPAVRAGASIKHGHSPTATSRHSAKSSMRSSPRRAGDFERLVSVLHPDVVLRGDLGGDRVRVTSARGGGRPGQAVRRTRPRSAACHDQRRAGAVIFLRGRPVSVMAFVVADGKITAIDALADPARVARLDLGAVAG